MMYRPLFYILGTILFLSGSALAQTTTQDPQPTPATVASLCVRFFNDTETIKNYNKFDDITLCSGQASRRIETLADFPMKFECVNPAGQVTACGLERRVSPDYCTGTPTQANVSAGQVLWNSYQAASIKNCTQQYRTTEETWTVAAATSDGQAMTMDLTAYISLPLLETSTTEFAKHGWISPWYTTEYPKGATISFSLMSDQTQEVCSSYIQQDPPITHMNCHPDGGNCFFEKEYTSPPHIVTNCSKVHDSFVWSTTRYNDYENTQLKPLPTANMPANTPISLFDSMYVVMTDDFWSFHDARMMLHGFQVVLPYWYCDISDKAGNFATTGIIVDHTMTSKTFPKFLSDCKEWKLRPHPLNDTEL